MGVQICNENDQVGQPIATFARTHDTCERASLATIGNVVLTGATSGLGRLAALDLASKGARLGIVARDPVKAAALHREIDAMGCDGGVDVFIADLSSLVDVQRVGREISNRFERIDVLINNAGLHAFSQRVTAEGLAEMMAVNYLAPWVLTDSLRDTLVSSAPARVSPRRRAASSPSTTQRWWSVHRPEVTRLHSAHCGRRREHLSKPFLLPSHDAGYCLPGKAPLATILVVNK